MEQLAVALKEVCLVKDVHIFDCIDSTNLQAKREHAAGAGDGCLVVADWQTAGRGRRGRAWQSPQGKNIYASLLLKPAIAPDKASMLTLVMALAVAKGIARTVSSSCGEGKFPPPEIKWPNDIVMNGKKVCGILTEMGMKQNAIDYVVIGVGINVHCQEFAPELVDKATDLETACGQPIDRTELLVNLLKSFEKYYALFLAEGSLRTLCEQYNALLVNRAREVCVLDPHGEYRGVAKGITDTGELRVELPDGSVTQVYAGEVSVRGVYGYV